ncbi:transcriptional regulator [Escherichia phage FL12]
MKFNYNLEYIPNPVAKLIDFDVVSTYVCPVKPLEIKETFMTARTIETGKTYKLVETEIKTTELNLGYKALTSVFGEGEFVVKSFSKSNWYDKNKAYVIRAHRLDNDEVIKTIVFEAELILFKEVDPTDLLTRAVAIKTPFISVCGWVTDQWIEDGVELLNVVHARRF